MNSCKERCSLYTVRLPKEHIMQNKDFVVALVQKTIQFTEILMEQDAVSWEKAKIGIQRIMLELTSDFPEHSAFIQSEMQIWIDQQDRKHATVNPIELRP
jgi:hypothetical protein